MGIQSAAYAGLVSYLVALGFLAFRLRRRNHVLAPDAALFAALRIDRAILTQVMRIGLPTGVADGGALAVRAGHSGAW